MKLAHEEFIRIFGDYKFDDGDAWAIFKQGWEAALQNASKEFAGMVCGGDTAQSTSVFLKNMATGECPPCNHHCKQGRECPSMYK